MPGLIQRKSLTLQYNQSIFVNGNQMSNQQLLLKVIQLIKSK